MRVAGRLAAEVLEMIGPYVQPGVTTDQLNQICHDYIVDVQKAIPAPLNYKGFPKSICTSVNHQVCHGIPWPRVLKMAISSISMSPFLKMNITAIPAKCLSLANPLFSQTV